MPLICATGERYTLKADYEWVSYTNANASSGILLHFTDGTTSALGIYASSAVGSATITSPANKTISAISVRGWSWSGEVVFRNIQLEQSSTATTYEPYKTAQVITCPYDLYSSADNTYADKIIVDGVGKSVKYLNNQGCLDLNDSTTYSSLAYTATGSYANCLQVTLPLSKYAKRGRIGNFCDFLSTAQDIYNTTNLGLTFTNNVVGDFIHCFIRIDNTFTSLEDYQNWIATENAAGRKTRIIYELSDRCKTETDITNTTFGQELLNAYTNNPNTTIIMSSDVSAPLSVTYNQDTNIVISSMQTQINNILATIAQ